MDCRLRLVFVTVVAMTIMLCPPMLLAGPRWAERVGTVRHAVSLPDGSSVYLDAVRICEIGLRQAPAYCAISECFEAKTRLIVLTQPSRAFSLGQTVDVKGTMTTLPDGRRAIVDATIYGYVDKDGNLLRKGPLIKGLFKPLAWQWKIDLTHPRALRQMLSSLLSELSVNFLAEPQFYTYLSEFEQAARERGYMPPSYLAGADLVSGASVFGSDAPADSIAYAKSHADAEPVTTTGKVVAATSTDFPNALYIQEPDRVCGIRVLLGTPLVPAPARGDTISVTGTVATGADKEREIEADSVTITGHPGEPGPLQLPIRTLGGSDFNVYTPGVNWPEGSAVGLNNKGLLVKICGRVTYADTANKCFYVDDGTGFDDGSGQPGVKVSWDWPMPGKPDIVGPQVGSVVSVVGISSSLLTPGTNRIVRVLRPRDQNDLAYYRNEAYGLDGAVVSGSGWSINSSTLEYAGGGKAGTVAVKYPVVPGKEYELSFTVNVRAYRASGADQWPAPLVRLAVNGETLESRRFFGDYIDRKRRIRFGVNPGQKVATFAFVGDASSTAATKISRITFTDVDSVPRDATLGIPYVGYNLSVPPGGGLVNGWVSGYNDKDMQAWIDAVKPATGGMMLRYFAQLDVGFANFDDDIWQFQDSPNARNTTQSDPGGPQYQNDPPKRFAWVTRPGAGYRTAAGAKRGFTQAYYDKMNAFLTKCDRNNVKVIPVLFYPTLDWAGLNYGPPLGTWSRFRKTVFDQAGDPMLYHDGLHRKYECDDPASAHYGDQLHYKDHTQMRQNYLRAITDWLDVFARKHPCVWGVDFFNEPTWVFGAVANDTRTVYYWHGLGLDVQDVDHWVDASNHRNHRLRDFLADAYDRVKAWAAINNRPIVVVSDVANEHNKFWKHFVDMAHPWASNPTRVRKVCDIFGPHWYRKYCDKDPNYACSTPTDYFKWWNFIWCSDCLTFWGNTTRQTEWMAEKPMVLAEIMRYATDDWGRRWDGDGFFEKPVSQCAGNPYICNHDWYTKLLHDGLHRHIESVWFWGAEGKGTAAHLLAGTPLDQGYPGGTSLHGWKAPYTAGTGCQAIKAFVPK